MKNPMSAVGAISMAGRDLTKRALSRRKFIQGTALGAAIGSVATARSASAQSPGLAGLPKLRDDLRLLVNRTTQGVTPASWQEALTRGFEGFREWQLDHENIDDSQVDALLAQLPSLTMTPYEIYAYYGDNSFYALYEMRLAALIRSYLSNRQLYNRMCEFWTDHFNIYGLKEGMWYFQPRDQLKVIQQHALGKFPAMLKASATSGAMLYYLDNYLSFVGSVNENYGREVLELHTVSVEGPYNEQDVKEVARCFTGWSINFNLDANYGLFHFYNYLHDQAPKTVLGHTIDYGGAQDGTAVLDILSTHPSTANFIAKKMTAWLLCEDPPQSLVDTVAQTYLSTGGDIKAMVRLILSHESIRQSDAFSRPKFQRPWRFAMALLRATNPTISDGFGIIDELDRMGNGPLYWPAPDGYPDKLSRWGNGVFARWSFASRLFGNEMYGVYFTDAQITNLFSGVPKSQVAHRASEILTGNTLPVTDVADIQAYVNSKNPANALLREALALTASSPNYQFF
jgi:uncharacterized protein (DUF1800 family)